MYTMNSSQWVSLGFFPLFFRNQDVKSDDETFWDTAFTLHCSLEQTTEERSQAETSDGNTKNENQTETWRRALAPSFLKPVMNEVMQTGKSMELLQHLGKLADVTSSCKGTCDLKNGNLNL
jgi:hypothetical protein